MRVQFCVLFFLLVLTACNKEASVPIDKKPPDVEIFSPDRNVIYSQGDTVFIKASMSDAGILGKGSVHIHDQLLLAGKDTHVAFRKIKSPSPF